MILNAKVKAAIKGIVLFIISAVLFLLVFDSVINRIIPFIRLRLVEINWIKPKMPEAVLPKPIPDSDIRTLELLQGPYVPSSNPFSIDNYEKIPKIIYLGKFSQVNLDISGKVSSDSPVVVLFNFARETGFIKSSRISKNQIDISDTNRRGGLIAPNQEVMLKINLLGDEIASSGDYFEKTGKPTHIINFINNTGNADSASLIAVPVDLTGTYGGATISSLLLSYKCENNSDCFIYNCNGATYSCMLERFGKPAADQWLKNFQANYAN